MGIEIREKEPVARSCFFMIGMHRILEPSGGADDRNRAVAKGDELPDTAGFVHRRHEEHLASGVNPLGQCIVKPNMDGYLLGVAPGQFPEPIFIKTISHA